MEKQGPGLLASDEELFARVWDRVTAAAPSPLPGPEPPTEVPAEPEKARVCPVPETALVAATPVVVAAPPVNATCAALQRWTLRLLLDATECRALARRAGRYGGELNELEREKRRQAKSLAAEYFLRTGVRYWPETTARPLPPLSLLPALRALYLAQRDRETALRAQAAQEEPELANRYLALADASRAAAHRLRALLESAW